MNWWVHRIGTDRAFQQLVDACCRSNGRGAHIGGAIARLWGWKLRVMMGVRMYAMVVDLVLINTIRGWHTLNVIQVHPVTETSHKWWIYEIPSNQNHKFHGIRYLSISFFESPPSILFVIGLFFPGKFTKKEEKKKIEGGRRGWSWNCKWVSGEPTSLCPEEQPLFLLR